MSVWEDYSDLAPNLRQLAKDGLSASEIARTLGHGLTRSAIISKCHRMKVKLAGSQQEMNNQAKRKVNKAKEEEKARLAREASIRTLESSPLEPLMIEGEYITLMTARDSHCRFPYGENTEIKFCGRNNDGKTRYCESHHSLCLQPPKTRP